MKMTLLEMVQNILSSINGDDVNSIGDTTQSQAVAEEVKTAYYVLLEQQDQPYQKEAVQLLASQNPSMPTHMKLSDNIKQLSWVKYNNIQDGKNNWENVEYLDPEEFLIHSLNISNKDTSKEVIDFSDVKIYVGTNQSPRHYTTFDEEWLIFDSYRSSVEDTLQETNTLAWAFTVPKWEMKDSFVPKLRVDLFPLLLAESKDAVFRNQKQVASSKDEQRSRRLITQHQNRSHRLAAKQRTSRGPDYSRP